MSEDWFLLRSGPGPAAENMALDEALLESATTLGRPVLRFYGWAEAAASFGCLQSYAAVASWTQLRPLIRRPTGGGLVAHDADWTYSLVFPPNHPWYALNAIESYYRLHEWLKQAFGKLGVITSLSDSCQRSAPGQCFIGAEKFDLLGGGQKMAGAAQRRNRQGLLIQGSVQAAGAPVSKANWEEAMLARVPCIGKVIWTEFKPDAPFCERIHELVRVKYSQAAYNQRR